MRTRSLVGLLLAAALLASACASGTTGPAAPSPAPSGPASAIEAHAVPLGATAPVDDATWALAERIAAPAYTGDSTDAFKAALAHAGIAVVPDTSTDPATATPEVPLSGTPSPVELLDFQAHALAVQAWGGTGWTGAELDSVVPLPGGTGSPSLADLLDGYVGGVDTPGAAFARALMAGQDLHDPATVRFPAAVLFLMVSDVATDGGTIAAPSASASAAARLLPLALTGPVVAAPALDVTDLCAGPDGLIDAVVQQIQVALTAALAKTPVGAVVVAVLGWLIHTVASFVKSAIDALLGPALTIIRSVFVLASGIAEQIASVMPYAVHVTVNGGVASGSADGLFDLGADSQDGRFDVAVTAGDLPKWPDVILACAQKAKLTLPDFSTKNAALTFEPIIVSYDQTPLFFRGSGAVDDTVTDQTGQAHWPFVVAADPGHGQGTLTHQSDTMRVAVHRKEIQQAREALTAALLGGLPEILRPYVGILLQPILDTFQSKLNDLLDARGEATVYLDYHLPSPSPSPSTTPSGSGACGVTLPAGTYKGTITSDSTTILSQGGITQGESGGDNSHATGPVTVTVAPEGTLGGNFQLTMQEHMVYQGPAQGTTDTTIQIQGAGVSGTLCSLSLTFASEIETGCQSTGAAHAPLDLCGSSSDRTTISLAGLVPPLPLGAPTSVAGGVLTWSISSENGHDFGFITGPAEAHSTITVTLQGP